MRGLIERASDSKDRSYSYQPTFDLLNILNFKIEKLPDYQKFQEIGINFGKRANQHEISKPWFFNFNTFIRISLSMSILEISKSSAIANIRIDDKDGQLTVQSR